MCVRFRVDTAEGRKLVAEKICPAEEKGRLSKAGQRRKAQEIILASKVNDLAKITEASIGTTFSQQAEWFLKHARTRNRKPVTDGTIGAWRAPLDKWLNPNIGDIPLSQLNNAVAKTLVAKMVEGGLAAKTTNDYFHLVKMVVASAVNDEGEHLFPRKWNSTHIDLPEVDEQNRPTFSAEEINLMLEHADEDTRMLIVLAAASGMRIGEILGLNIARVSPDRCTINVTEKVYRGVIDNYLKTKNGKRIVDLDPRVGTMLRDYIGSRAGLVFASRTGKPVSQTNILFRRLHPLQEKLGLKKCGPHSFRRYRTTWLRKQRCPEGLVQFWLGHAGKTTTDDYDMVREDVEYRKKVAAEVGIGFIIPQSVLPKVQSVQREELVNA
jgi:integrase